MSRPASGSPTRLRLRGFAATLLLLAGCQAPVPTEPTPSAGMLPQSPGAPAPGTDPTDLPRRTAARDGRMEVARFTGRGARDLVFAAAALLEKAGLPYATFARNGYLLLVPPATGPAAAAALRTDPRLAPFVTWERVAGPAAPPTRR